MPRVSRNRSRFRQVIETNDSSLLPALIAALLLTSTMAAASVTDLRARVIPDRLTAPAAAAGLVLAAATGGAAGLAAAVGTGLAVALPLWGVARIRPEGMGMGDVKLVAVIGIYLGLAAWGALLAALALAALTGVLISLGQRRSPAETTLPLAPFLATGTIPVVALAVAAAL